MKRTILFSLITLCFTHVLFAQPQIKGQVTNSAGSGIAYATVSFVKEGARVAASVTDTLGMFSIKVHPDKYMLHIQHLSYQTSEYQIQLDSGMIVSGKDGVARIDIGMFELDDASLGMKEVVVTATSVSREADRFIMRVNQTAALAGQDGTELLARAPGVWIDDSGVAINGMKGAKVYINDREVKLSGDNLIAYLKGISSSDISTVEVIPHAGAEYSADSRGGIVKITLRKKRDNGVGGSLQFATAQGESVGNYAPSGNLYARTGKWSLNGAASGIFTTKGEGSYVTSREYLDHTGAIFHGSSQLQTKKNSGMGRFGAIYDINRGHSMGGEIEYSRYNYKIPSDAQTSIVQNGTEIKNKSRYDQRSDYENVSATFNYLWNIDTIGSSLKLITDYTCQITGGDNTYHTNTQVHHIAYDSLSRSNNSSDYQIFTAELALRKILSKSIIFNGGIKYTRNDMGDKALYEGRTETGWEARRDYSYMLDYCEEIGAAYASASANIKRWSFSAGLRGEYTNTRGKGGDVNRSYFELFPNVSVTYACNNLKTWMLIGQYARNTERPGFLSLNPTRIQHSDYSYQTGNPALRPTFIHRLSATVVFKYRHSLTIGANLHKDLIREVCKTDPANKEVTYITPENHFMENHYFVALNTPLMFAKWWNLTINFVGVKQDIKLTKESSTSTHYLMFANAISGFTLPAKFYAELSYNGNSKLYSGNSGIGARHIVHAAVKKRILHDKFTLSLAMQNIFNSKTEYFSVTDHFVNTMRGFSGLDSRYCKISMIFNFNTGKSFKAKKLETSATEERDRLKNKNL